MQNVRNRVLVGFIVGLLLVSCAASTVATTAVTVRATGSELAFQPATVTVPAGKQVVLTFENSSAFSHDFILVEGNEATLTAVDAGGDAAGEAGGYVPVGVPGMLAHSQLLLPGTTEVVTFTAPAPGTYFYFCTYPAHLEGGMRGVLIVK